MFFAVLRVEIVRIASGIARKGFACAYRSAGGLQNALRAFRAHCADIFAPRARENGAVCRRLQNYCFAFA
ncbi:MAG: hypothetical protein DBX55_01865 [Verrucomicrobia bacterium]|nr:MAG: hypothetical protein DBX55_01865 [Verrucomicrobiota bacterium]